MVPEDDDDRRRLLAAKKNDGEQESMGSAFTNARSDSTGKRKLGDEPARQSAPGGGDDDVDVGEAEDEALDAWIRSAALANTLASGSKQTVQSRPKSKPALAAKGSISSTKMKEISLPAAPHSSLPLPKARGKGKLSVDVFAEVDQRKKEFLGLDQSRRLGVGVGLGTSSRLPTPHSDGSSTSLKMNGVMSSSPSPPVGLSEWICPACTL